MPLYHKDAYGFPKGISFRPVFNLIPSAHAEREADSDRYGLIAIPRHFHPNFAQVIEIETDNSGNLVKILARQELDARRDVVYAFLVVPKLIKTLWCNEKNDLHRTLDKGRYDKPA